MGDVSQNVNYECGMNDWRDMKEKIFCKDTDEFRLLSKSYRNTIEISEFAGKILDRASKGAYKIESVIRHGQPVQTIQEMTEQGTQEIHPVRERQERLEIHRMEQVLLRMLWILTPENSLIRQPDSRQKWIMG